MRILVTGGSGFIGSNFISRVIKQPGIEMIVNLDAMTYAGSHENLSEMREVSASKYAFIEGDIRDPIAVSEILESHDITHVVNFAAETHVDRSIGTPEAFVHTNVVGTANLLERTRQAWQGSSEKHMFLHISTDEVYGSLRCSDLSSTENSKFAPNSPYAASKAASDMLVRSYSKTFNHPVVTTHCSNNYGPRQHKEKLIPKIVDCCINNKPIPLYGDGLNLRDWIYVDDHVDALWTILNSSAVGEEYCIGANCEKNNRQVINAVTDALKMYRPYIEPKIEHVADRPGHDFRYSISSTKLMSSLGWKPKVTFDDGIWRTVRWYVGLRY